MKLTINNIRKLKECLNISKDVDIIAIRGCSCSEYGKWQKEINIEQKEIDNEHMNCLFILIDVDKILPLQGSTTPHKKYLLKGLNNDGNGVNQLEYGFYKYYAKGIHGIGRDSGHKALRQTRNQPVRRTSDNLVFDDQDNIEIGNVHDNIHASWSKLNSSDHASAGCQVIQGYPECKKRKTNSGHWKLFYNHIYSLDQYTFNYLLIPFRWVERVVNNIDFNLIIFGSESNDVKQIQKYFKLSQDGIYGQNTYNKVIEFQKKYNLTVDGIVGNNTIKRMGKI